MHVFGTESHAGMAETLSGKATAFYLYDVADAIDLSQVRARIDATAPAQLTAKITAPSHV